MTTIDDKIIIDKLEIYYRIKGDKNNPFLVFIAGWGTRYDGNMFSNEKVVNELSEYFYVIAPEMPGLMRSTPPDSIWNFKEYASLLHLFLEKLQISSFILVGQSFGGGVASTYAAIYSKKVKQLVLVDAVLKNRSTTLYSFLKKSLNYLLFHLLTKKFIPISIKRMLISLLLGVPSNHVSSTSPSEYAVMGKISQDYHVDIDYKELSMPLVLIWGKQDIWVTPLKNAIKLHEELPQSSLIILQGGHTLLYKRTKEVANIIAELIVKFKV